MIRIFRSCFAISLNFILSRVEYDILCEGGKNNYIVEGDRAARYQLTSFNSVIAWSKSFAPTCVRAGVASSIHPIIVTFWRTVVSLLKVDLLPFTAVITVDMKNHIKFLKCPSYPSLLHELSSLRLGLERCVTATSPRRQSCMMWSPHFLHHCKAAILRVAETVVDSPSIMRRWDETRPLCSIVLRRTRDSGFNHPWVRQKFRSDHPEGFGGPSWILASLYAGTAVSWSLTECSFLRRSALQNCSPPPLWWIMTAKIVLAPPSPLCGKWRLPDWLTDWLEVSGNT